MNKLLGFTIAEILIALGIIGIIAESTIPDLIASYEKQVYVTQLKQTYSLLSSAINMMMADEGINKITYTNTLTADVSEDSTDTAVLNRAGGFLKKYFKVVKDCGAQHYNPCWASTVKNLNGQIVNDPESMGDSYYCVIIANGSSICILPGNQSNAGSFAIDINGLKRPNVSGRDIFSLSYYYDGSITNSMTPACRKETAMCPGDITKEEFIKQRYDLYCSTAGSGGNSYSNGCFTKIISDNWKMDY